MSKVYESRKRCILHMIFHYEDNSRFYINHALLNNVTLDELTAHYEYDQQMLEKYQGELALLEAEHILHLI